MADSEEMTQAIHEQANNIVEGLEETARQWYTGEIEDYEVIRRYGKKVDPGLLQSTECGREIDRLTDQWMQERSRLRTALREVDEMARDAVWNNPDAKSDGEAAARTLSQIRKAVFDALTA